MSFDRAVSVHGLGKRYWLSQMDPRHNTLGEALLWRFRNPLHRRRREEFWALQDVSFDINPGEAVGIVGRNGAGKSTLLKLLSRIIEPTHGQIDLWGRVGSLIEVGTGFHPELTGRENIFLNGTILGMSRSEIRKQFDAIVDFADIEKWLDIPVKRYASGMYVRLAFSVAAHLNPDILIVDEVLAVGDAVFQKKCLGKMHEVTHDNSGRTVLFVSHNMAAVRALCSRALLLHQGSLVLDADVESVLAAYLRETEGQGTAVTWLPPSHKDTPVYFTRARLLNAEGEPLGNDLLDYRDGFMIAVEYEVREVTRNLRIGFSMENTEFVHVCESRDPAWSGSVCSPGHYEARISFPGFTLNEGSYFVLFSADVPNDRVLDHTGRELSFNVYDTTGHGTAAEKLQGVLRPLVEWEVTKP